jgi:putative N-acetylmannosamine-6-phosphate epimerase/predicted NBD/HSP70 family sugar kinase
MVLEQLRGGLLVSCQASPGDPLEDTETIRRIARAAVGAGAAGLRINSAEQIAAIRKDTAVPIIGIRKHYSNGKLLITPDFSSAAELAEAGATIIALDCTNRTRNFGEPWQEILPRIQKQLKLPVMADVATLAEALAAAACGADFLGTTLHGYTEDTRHSRSFNWKLLADLAAQCPLPIIAEGHISTPQQARRTIAEGAFCVVVGSAITRPGLLTARFVKALKPTREGAPVIGADLGGTSIKAGIIDRRGEASLIARIPTQGSEGRDVIASNLASCIEQVLAKARSTGISPCGLGIASAGAVDAQDGSIFAATENLPGWTGFPLRSFAEKRFGLPTWVLNDAHAVVLAEQQFGLGANLSDFVVVTLGTGVGGGVVCHGRLLQGQHGFAGTIGHQTIRIDGRPCNCGRAGCLEAYVSTAALLREYSQQRGETGPEPGLTESAMALKINQLAFAGDACAQRAYDALSGYLAEGIANIFTLFDPQAVLLCGGLIEGLPQFVAGVEKRVREILPFGARRSPRIILATGGSNAGMIGAGAFVFSES